MCRLGYSCHSVFSCPQLGVEAGPCSGMELLMNSAHSSFSEAPGGVTKKGPSPLWKLDLSLRGLAFCRLRVPRCLPAPGEEKLPVFQGRAESTPMLATVRIALLSCPNGIPRSGAEMRGKDLGIQGLTADYVTTVLTGDHDQYLQISS